MSEIEHLKQWITALIAGLDAEVDEGTRTRIMEYCGRACAAHFGSLDIVKTARSKTSDIDEILDLLNQQEDFWCGKWLHDGQVICSVCEACGCPLIRVGLVELSPTFCQCSIGWVKLVFETALGKPVEVNLEQAIGHGDKVCRYVVMPKR